MGVSWGGKGTLRKNLNQKDIQNLEFIKSYVSRPMRPGEVNGDMYWFISEEEFKEWIENNEFLEYEWVHDAAYYGTKKSDIDSWLESGKAMIKEIDIKWLIQLKEKQPKYFNEVTSFFLDVPEVEIERRYYERNPDGDAKELEKRLISAKNEREQAKKYCTSIIDATQSPEQVLQEVLDIIHTKK